MKRDESWLVGSESWGLVELRQVQRRFGVGRSVANGQMRQDAIDQRRGQQALELGGGLPSDPEYRYEPPWEPPIASAGLWCAPTARRSRARSCGFPRSPAEELPPLPLPSRDKAPAKRRFPAM